MDMRKTLCGALVGRFLNVARLWMMEDEIRLLVSVQGDLTKIMRDTRWEVEVAGPFILSRTPLGFRHGRVMAPTVSEENYILFAPFIDYCYLFHT